MKSRFDPQLDAATQVQRDLERRLRALEDATATMNFQRGVRPSPNGLSAWVRKSEQLVKRFLLSERGMIVSLGVVFSVSVALCAIFLPNTFIPKYRIYPSY